MSQLGDRNLLFGLLALEDYLISRDALIAAMKAWVTDKTKGIGQILREHNALSENNTAVVEERVHLHLVKHDHDVERCLADVKLPDPVKRDLEKIGDADLSASLARVGAPVVIIPVPIVVAPTPRPDAPIMVAPTPRDKSKPTPVKPVAKAMTKKPQATPAKSGGPSIALLLFGGATVFALVFMVIVGAAVGFFVIKSKSGPPPHVNLDKPADKNDDKKPPEKDKKPDDQKLIDPPPVIVDRKPTEIVGDAVWRIDGSELVATNVPTKRAYVFFGSKDWTDYDFTFETKSESGRTGTLALFRANGEMQHYGLSLGSFLSKKHSLSRVEKGLVVYDVPHVSTKYDLNHWYKVKIEVRGEKIRASIDDEQVFDTNNAAHPRGLVALGTTSDSRARWKNIKVTATDGKALWDGLPELSPTAVAPPAAAGFVTLFNGKDLSGWKNPTLTGEWRVKDGVLVGIGPGNRVSRLHTEGKYKNFHLKTEVRAHEQSHGLVAIRSDDGRFHGYNASIRALIPNAALVGALNVSTGQKGYTLPRGMPELQMPLGQWFTLEMIAEGNRLTLLIDGKKVTEATDGSMPDAGFVYLGASGVGDIEFRKIEIKELAEVAAPPVALVGGFVQLFNGKDLTGWVEDMNAVGTWRVQNGHLVSGGNPKRVGTLKTADMLPKDFHLRMELRSDRSEGNFLLRANADATIAYDTGFNYTGPNGTLRAGNLFFNDAGRQFQMKASAITQINKGDWFTLEYIFDGNKLVTKVNGNTVADVTNAQQPNAGHLVIRPWSIFPIEFRKIEVKPLNGGQFVVARPVVPPIAAEGFTALFNGKDLTGFVEDKNGPGTWRVENGNLVAAFKNGNRPSALATEKTLPKDFHLRMEARGDDTMGTILVRGTPDGTTGYQSIYQLRTGNLRAGGISSVEPGKASQLKPPLDINYAKGTWFTLEYVFENNRLITKVNGVTASDVTNAAHPNAGHLVIRPASNAPLEFRKIEVKALNPGQVVAVPPVLAPAEGFTALFNGKDLTGWVKDKFAAEMWHVENGLLQRKNMTPGKLSSELDLPKDFHLRIEGRFNALGGLTMLVRSPDGSPRGYHTTLQQNPNGLSGAGLMTSFPGNQKMLARPQQLPAPIDGWFRFEILAQGNRLITKVDGKTVSDVMDDTAVAAGKFVFIEGGPPSIQIQRIEVKPLEPGAIPVVAPAPKLDANEFIKLFNGKDLTGWKKHPQVPGEWQVVDGVLTGTTQKAPGRIETDKPLPRDFHLRIVARVNDKGTASVIFRCQEGSLAGYEAPINSTQPFIAKTGSLYAQIPGKRMDLVNLKDTPIAPGQWFTLEIIAEASRLTVKVDGETTVNTLDSNRLSPGHIALMCVGQTTVDFRSIEIKGLRQD